MKNFKNSKIIVPCNTPVVNIKFKPEIENKAVDMINKYGKEQAYKNSMYCKDCYITDIEILVYYDKDKIKSLQDKVWEWHEIAQCIKLNN